MNKRKVDLFVLESVWDDKLVSETSVRPFFDGLCRAYDINYVYHTFYRKEDLRHFIKESRRQKLSCSDYYIAAHGSRNGIKGLKNIKKEDLKEIFKDFRGKGIYFGSCWFINFTNAEEILDDTKADWVAGYNSNVDWFDSTIIDIIFWRDYFNLNGEKRFAWDIVQEIYKNYPKSIEFKFSVSSKWEHGKKVINSLQYYNNNISIKT